MRRALVATGPAGGATVGLQLKPKLSPGPTDLVCRPIYVGFCGTDLELIGGLLPPQYVNYPLVIGKRDSDDNNIILGSCKGQLLGNNACLFSGHEWSGQVAQVGSEVTGFAIGDHVVVAGLVPCMECHRCKNEDTNICTTYQEIG